MPGHPLYHHHTFCVVLSWFTSQVVLHGWNNFRAMITGFEVVKETDESTPSAMREQAEIIPLKSNHEGP